MNWHVQNRGGDFSLGLLNDALEAAERQRISGFAGPKLRPVIVVGAPRSGHTLFSQILAATGAFGYISNFTARFWKAPVLAAELQQSLGLSEEPIFTSNHGRIAGWTAPHEGGRFLQRLIKLGDTHVADRRPSAEALAEWRSEVAALEDFHGRNVLLRNAIYGLNLPILADALPEALIVVCRRDPLFQAQSIFEARTSGASANAWWSAKPSNFRELANLDWPEQVAGQIAGYYEAVEAHRHGSPGNVLDIWYEDYVADPVGQVGRVFTGANIDATPGYIPAIRSTNEWRVPAEVRGRLTAALERYSEKLTQRR